MTLPNIASVLGVMPASAGALATTGASVNIGASDPPIPGQVPVAVDATHATWQTISPGGGATTYFLDDTASDLGGYAVLSRKAITGTAEAEDSVSSSSGIATLIETYASPLTDPGTTVIQSGVWELSVWAKTSAGSTSTLQGRWYTRTAGGVETLVGTVNTPTLTSAYPVPPYTLNLAVADLTVDVGTRIVLKLYAVTTGSVVRTIAFTHNGTARYSHMVTPGSTASTEPGLTLGAELITITGSNPARANMASGRRAHTAELVGTNVYVMGSTGAAGAKNSCLNLLTNAWTDKADLPAATQGLAAAVAGTLIYFCGGYVGVGHSTQHYYYDTVANTYTSRAALGAKIGDHAYQNVADLLYKTGGGDDESGFATHEAYNPATNAWTALTSITYTAGYSPGACVLGGVLHVCGGYDSGNVSSANRAYSVSGNSWSSKTVMPSMDYGHTYTALSGVGVKSGGSEGKPENTSYNPTTNAWTSRSAVTGGRYMHAAVAYGDQMMIIGGYNTAGGEPVEVMGYVLAPTGYTATRPGVLTSYLGDTMTNTTSGIAGAIVPVKLGDTISAGGDTWGSPGSKEAIFV